MKYYRLMCLSIFILCLFCACNVKNNYQSESSNNSNKIYSENVCDSEVAKNKNEKEDGDGKFDQKISETDFFLKQIEENPIDKSYEKELEMLEDISPDFQKKYIDIWVDELEFSVLSLSEKLSEEDQGKLVSLQKKWKTETEELLDFEKSIFTNENYGMKSYTSLNFSLLSVRMNCYRERTIRIKYWIYCFDKANSNYYNPTVQFLYRIM